MQRRRFIVEAGGVHASFTKFQTQLASWSRASEGAYHQFVAL